MPPLPLSHNLIVKQPNEPCTEWPLNEPLAKDYKYELDNFQKHAVSAIHRESNVLVTAKTGSGKTMVGEYQIAYSLAKGKRVFYTTPIKSLSNQKFNDLKAMFPSVGIMTGDIKFQPQAQVVVLTTEILRNLLYKHGTVTESLGLSGAMSLDGLDAVIFDEVHYINNPDRGKVWEETMIMLPPEVKLILLSATIDRPELFASWLGDLRQREIILIPTTHRIVPLTHTVIGRTKDGQPELKTIMDNKEVFYDGVYREWLQTRKSHEIAVKKHADRVKRRDWTDETDTAIARSLDERTKSFTATLNETIAFLKTTEALPALFFCFSRKGCEEYAERVSEGLLTGCEIADVKHIIKFHLRDHIANLEHLPQYHTILRLTARGIAFHHSGLLPVLKEVIEILFSKGLIRALFCTETFAVGINMPTKTAVFLGLKKYDDTLGAPRIITTDEYIQMAGRAGRRGLDKFGLVIYLPEDEPLSVSDLKTMMKSGMPSITSRMDFGYDFILKTLHSEVAQSVAGQPRWITIMKQSYWYRQAEERKGVLECEIESINKKQVALNLPTDVLEEFRQLDDLVATNKLIKTKDTARAIDHWKNRHVGPKWIAAERAYKQYRDNLEDIETIRKRIHAAEKIMSGQGLVADSMQFLREVDFIGTVRGTIATELNEIHPIMGAEFYMLNGLDGLDQNDLCVVLSAFLEKEKGEPWTFRMPTDISDAASGALKRLAGISTELRDLEAGVRGVAAKPEYWDLSCKWPSIIQRYLDYIEESTEEESAAVTTAVTLICQETGIYEGNFVRSILKLSNMLEELQGVATYMKNIELLKVLEGATRKLVTGLIVPDSLYLR